MPPNRKFVAVIIALALALTFGAFRPPPGNGPVERDFEAYYAAGATYNAGGDPYSRAIWAAERRVPGVDAARDEILPYVGPAAALPLWSLLARLPYGTAVIVWSACLTGALLALVGAALAVARERADPWRSVLAAAFVLVSAPTVGALALGQTALLSAGAVAVALVAYATRRPASAAAATLLAAIQPNLALIFIARPRSRWDLCIAAGAACIFGASTLALGGGGAGLLAYLRRLAAHGGAERDIAIQHTPGAVAYALGATAPGASIIGLAVGGLTAATVAIVIVRARLDATTATLLACAALPLMVPFFHEPDFAIVVCPLLVLALRARGRPRALASVAAVLLLVDWFGFAQRFEARGQIVCLALALTCAFAGLRRAGTAGHWDLAGLAAFVVLAAIALPLGAAHRAPSWPEMLPAHYRADSGADISAVWGAEQRDTGLGRRDPVWGLLRAIPLSGCVVLSWALIADARQRRRRDYVNAGLPERKRTRPVALTA